MLLAIAAGLSSGLVTQSAGGAPWIAPYEPAYKLSAGISDSTDGAVDVTALLFDDGDDDTVLESLRALGATQVTAHRTRLNHLVRFQLDRSRLADAAALADVAWVEPTPVYTFANNQAQWVVQSGVQDSRPVTDRETFAHIARAILEEELPLPMPIRLMGLTLANLDSAALDEPPNSNPKLARLLKRTAPWEE